jgi:tetratricopeptide (TPR) repeat protein
MNRELPDDLYQEIKNLCSEGDSLADGGHHADAIRHYERALALLPNPHEMWAAATWIYAAIGDSHFLSGQYELARQALTAVMLCPNALENPFLWLRRAQVYFELGDVSRAKDSLASACMLAGPEIFRAENPKYSALILPMMNAVGSAGAEPE